MTSSFMFVRELVIPTTSILVALLQDNDLQSSARMHQIVLKSERRYSCLKIKYFHMMRGRTTSSLQIIRVFVEYGLVDSTLMLNSMMIFALDITITNMLEEEDVTSISTFQ